MYVLTYVGRRCRAGGARSHTGSRTEAIRCLIWQVAAQKREREAIKAQMMKDRGEVAARGPAEAAKAKALPTVGGGIKKFEQEEDNGQ